MEKEKEQMKKSILAAVMMVGVASGAYAAAVGTVGTTNTAATISAGGVIGSDHDLHDPAAANGVGTQVCVYCHTPHNSNGAVAAPLWSHALSSNASYTPYFNPDFSQVQGQTVPGTVSQACLGCHDGSIALGYVANGAFSIGGQDGQVANLNAADGGPADGTSTIMSDSVIGGSGDLSTTHPIGIAYPTGSNVFKDPSTFAGNVKLFIEGGGGATQVECASCHEPHNQGAQEGRYFLRSTNDGSALCLSCHIK
jgi:predicted CXXCH cytochrome family protein